MAKDPAFLFYSADFLIGTALFTDDQVGKYIKLLCYQHQTGHLNEKQVITICGGKRDEEILIKFSVDQDGKYFNVRLDEESNKRKKFCESRRLSRTSNVRKTYVPRMENENENENIKEKTNNILNKAKENFESVWGLYPRKLGKHEAFNHFKAQVKTDKDLADISVAIVNFLKSDQCKGEAKFIPHGSTWFNQRWRDWIAYRAPSAYGSQDDREEWRKKADPNCIYCQGGGGLYAPGSGKIGKCGCVK